MTVEIQLQGLLAEKYGHTKEVNLEDPVTVNELITKVGLPKNELGIVVVDGMQKSMSDLISENCRVSIYPWLSGG